MQDKKMMKETEQIFGSLPDDRQEYLMKILKESKSQKDFIRRIMVADCPVCGSENTRDCSDTPIDDPTVGICLDCFTMGCLECGEIFKEGQKNAITGRYAMLVNFHHKGKKIVVCLLELVQLSKNGKITKISRVRL